LAPLFFGARSGASIALQLCRVMIIAALASTASLARAQLDIPGPIHLTHVEGYVFNTHGKPVADAVVTLVRDGNVAASTQTDSSGTFRLDTKPGDYILHVARTQFAPADRDVIVTDEVVTHLERKKLYVVVGPGACKDECSSVLTSKKEFRQLIKRDNAAGQ
jgi:hypothetical protein